MIIEGLRRSHSTLLQTPENIAYVLQSGDHVPVRPGSMSPSARRICSTRWDYENIKMTKREVKDERKQAEGDHVIKNKQRQKMMAVISRRMMQDVPKADVVITNPTHLAIAIRYDVMEAPAPLILAKGAGAVAERIKEIARQNNVPVRENKPLARALYKAVEVGDVIPEEFYQAVAAILAQVYKARPR